MLEVNEGIEPTTFAILARPAAFARFVFGPGWAALDPPPSFRYRASGGASSMTQNIYDREEFFEAFGRLTRSIEGLDGAPEWPALRALLPDLHGLKVVDLGCGYEWFSRWAREQGAAHVVGVDVSERMLARARARTHDAGIAYIRADMEHIELPRESFALAYSSLAFHYLDDLSGLLCASMPRSFPAAVWSSRSSTR